MNDKELLLEVLSKELEGYRLSLLDMPCSEAIEHSFEYTVKKDIVIAIENSDLSNIQYKALCNFPFPLEAIYSSFSKLDSTDYMEQLCWVAEIEAEKVITI